MLESAASCDATSRSALDEAFLDHERLEDVLNRVAGFAHRSADGVEPNGSSSKLADQHIKIAAVHAIESKLVDIEMIERVCCESPIDDLQLFDVCIVSNTP
jgi:hypothetical protein